jgi:hypothetical protein
VQLAAWLSLASQILVLIGSRGLSPIGEDLARTRAAGLGFWDEPSLFWFAHGDRLLLGGTALGALLSMLALFSFRPRLCFALSVPLYLSYASSCGRFTSFQWDNMLVEVSLLAACLPTERAAPLAHFAFRALLFKLYFESGIAKWQSHLHDWQDGSAMSFYYETAPLPAALAWYAHQLPGWWHRLESWGALGLELVVPFAIWGPRQARLLAFWAFSSFQIINTATANYGFFTYLSLALHVFLLSDTDLVWLRWPRSDNPHASPRSSPDSGAALPAARGWRQGGARLALGAWLLASAMSGLLAFSNSSSLARALGEVEALYEPLRLANVYHLFGHITRERIEPQFETQVEGEWLEQDLRYKPGAVLRAPRYVAPHQPRVDFLLWFYGLGFQRGMPRYVARLLERLCHDPEAVQALFGEPLPHAPRAARVVMYRYHFSNSTERAQTGAYWLRQRLGALPARECDGVHQASERAPE